MITIKNAIEVLQGLENGKKIQIMDGSDWRDYTSNLESVIFAMSKGFNFRIKLESEVIPWTFENAPPLIKAKLKSNPQEIILLQLSFAPSWNCWSFWSHKAKEYISFAIAARDYVQLDGSPCGNIEEACHNCINCIDKKCTKTNCKDYEFFEWH